MKPTSASLLFTTALLLAISIHATAQSSPPADLGTASVNCRMTSRLVAFRADNSTLNIPCGEVVSVVSEDGAWARIKRKDTSEQLRVNADFLASKSWLPAVKYEKPKRVKYKSVGECGYWCRVGDNMRTAEARRMPNPGECKSVQQPDNTWATVCNQAAQVVRPANMTCRISGQWLYCN